MLFCPLMIFILHLILSLNRIAVASLVLQCVSVTSSSNPASEAYISWWFGLEQLLACQLWSFALNVHNKDTALTLNIHKKIWIKTNKQFMKMTNDRILELQLKLLDTCGLTKKEQQKTVRIPVLYLTSFMLLINLFHYLIII